MTTMGKKKQKKEDNESILETKAEDTKAIYFSVFEEEIRRIEEAGIDDFIAQSLKRLWYYVTTFKFDDNINIRAWQRHYTLWNYFNNVNHSEEKRQERNQQMASQTDEIIILENALVEFEKKYHEIKKNFPTRAEIDGD